MKIAHRRRFGLALDPWASLEIDTADALRVAEMVEATVEAQAFVSVLGPRGVGKTRAVRSALARHERVRVVEPLRLTRERLHMGDIETAIVRDLSDEAPRRSGEARSHQVRRTLGPASREARVVLVLDDSHVLHHATLRGLKRLRELAWLGRAPLIGIVLIGQRDRTEMVPEVGLRSDRMVMAGLTRMEVMCALERTGYRAVFEAGALSRLGGCARAALARPPGARRRVPGRSARGGGATGGARARRGGARWSGAGCAGAGERCGHRGVSCGRRREGDGMSGAIAGYVAYRFGAVAGAAETREAAYIDAWAHGMRHTVEVRPVDAAEFTRARRALDSRPWRTELDLVRQIYYADLIEDIGPRGEWLSDDEGDALRDALAEALFTLERAEADAQDRPLPFPAPGAQQEEQPRLRCVLGPDDG